MVWTRETLTAEHRDYLAGLPHQLDLEDGLLIVHGSVRDRDEYVLRLEDAAPSFIALEGRRNGGGDAPADDEETKVVSTADLDDVRKGTVVFYGHTHRPVCYERSGNRLRSFTIDDRTLDPAADYIINPGSVGQPRDRDPRCAYAIYDSDTRKLSYHRVGYDIDGCYHDILEAGLPKRLGERLFRGV